MSTLIQYQTRIARARNAPEHMVNDYEPNVVDSTRIDCDDGEPECPPPLSSKGCNCLQANIYQSVSQSFIRGDYIIT